MSRLSLNLLSLIGIVGLCASAWAQTSVRSVRVLGGKDPKAAIEIEIDGSDKLAATTRTLTGPERLVIDFANAVPGTELRAQSVNRGAVKDVRVGLFQQNPPITRVVIDLNSEQSFEVFPEGRTVMLKLTGSSSAAAQNKAAAPAQASGPFDGFPPARPSGSAENSAEAENRNPAVPEASPLDVRFENGLLSIHANKVSLSEVLFAVHERTGADVEIAAGAEQEKVVVDLGPGPAPDVLSQLLNGSRFNFLIISAPNDPKSVDRVILTMRNGGVPPVASSQEADKPEAQPPVAAAPGQTRPQALIPATPAEQNAEDNPE